uniref:Uncharacterized protein n=1 Tax=Poecilia formosa TaxID=48698 RepID=A0A087XFE2_POEFO
TFVTLAEVLEARGGPLLEEEIWSLLLGAAECLMDVSYKGHNNMCSIISPTSLLLSATGTLAFKNCGLSDEVSAFAAPEMLQDRAGSTKPATDRMLVYSLGMTLYWSVDFQLPQNQPVQLSDHLNSILLSMCEDLAHRRVNLTSILEACESQHKASNLLPPTKVVRQLVEEVFHESMDGSLPDSNIPLSGRSQMIRERLHNKCLRGARRLTKIKRCCHLSSPTCLTGKRGPLSDFSEGSAEGRRYSTDSDSKSGKHMTQTMLQSLGSLPQRPWRQRPRSSPTLLYQSSLDRLYRFYSTLFIFLHKITQPSTSFSFTSWKLFSNFSNVNGIPNNIWLNVYLQKPHSFWHNSGKTYDEFLNSKKCSSKSFEVISILMGKLTSPKSNENSSTQRLLILSFLPCLCPVRLPRRVRRRDSNCSWIGRSPHHNFSPKASGRSHSPSITFSESSLSLSQRKAKVRTEGCDRQTLNALQEQKTSNLLTVGKIEFSNREALGPEFVRMPDEQQILLELPGSIVSKKGHSSSSQREVTVVLPNGQCVVVRCDIKSRARDVFDMVVAHANLVEHFYFGLSFLDDDEYFFLDHETKISKVAPDSWKKGQISSFLVFLRVKFFVDDIAFVLHRLTRHQYYLQLRKDILEDRLYCNEETGLFLAALALQAEFGDYMAELYGKDYYQPEHYVSKRMLEKLAVPIIREELPRLHASHAHLLPEEAETEYLKIVQQLPEYGVMFHRVGREKRPLIGELVLGVCAKGIIVYETKNHLRTVTRRFLWRETDSISTGRRKLIIECGGPSGKKHIFVTETSKIAQYLLNLCSAQHKFHSEMTSRQLNHTMIPGGTALVISPNILPYFPLLIHTQELNRNVTNENISAYRARNMSLKRISCSEGMLNHVGLTSGQADSLSKSCDDLTAKLEARLRQQREMRREMGRDLNNSPGVPRRLSSVSLQKLDSDASSSLRGDNNTYSCTDLTTKVQTTVKSSFVLCNESSNTDIGKTNLTNSVKTHLLLILVDTPTRAPPEREIVCVILKKDPKLGFAGFVIVGEDNTGKLDLGIFIASIVPDGPADKDGRIKPGGRLISLNKTSLEGVTFSDAAAILQNSPDEVELIVSQPKRLSLERSFGSQTTLSGTEFRPPVEELEEAIILSSMATPKHNRKLHIPVVRIHDAQHNKCRFKTDKTPYCLPCRQKDASPRSPSILSLKTGDRFTIDIKKSGGSLGKDNCCSKKGGINTNVQFGGIYIKSLVPGGAAEQDGRIQTGDRLLEVDGTNLRGVTHQQAVECLKRTGEVVNLLLEREPTAVLEHRPDSPCYPLIHSPSYTQSTPRTEVSMETTLSGRAKDYSFVTDENTHEVVLKKSLSGLGFSFYISQLRSGADRGSVVRIKRLFPGQPAQESGQLREGDIILSVNGEHVKDLSYQRVLFLLRGAPSEVHLVICRPPPGVLYEYKSSNITPKTVARHKDFPPPPSPPRTPPSPTSPTSPPSLVSPLSPTSPSSPPPASPPIPPEPQPAAGKQEEQEEGEAERRKTEDEEEASATLSSALMLIHFKATSKNIRPAVPPPQPPPITPITAQIISSVPPCAGAPTPTLPSTVLTCSAQIQPQLREEPERKGMIKEFELTVVLTKSRSGSFGFTITRSKIDNCYYIQEILDNPAKADGRLRAGDRLITVNGHDVTCVADDVAMTVLRSSPRRLNMTLGRAVSNLVAPPPCDSLPDVVLHKTPSGQLGIKLTGGIGSKWQGIYCLEVVPGSPASEEGSVKPNDKILYICGRCTLGMTLEDAVKACEIAPRKVKLKIIREDQPVTPKAKKLSRLRESLLLKTVKNGRRGGRLAYNEIMLRAMCKINFALQSCIMQVEFKKPEGGGLGFALVGGANGSMLRVREICSGGVAEQDGRLKVGDILLEVNGVIVSGLSHSKVVDILRKAEGTVQLTICRDILPLTYSESPTPPNMSAHTEAILAEQPAHMSNSDVCSAPESLQDRRVVTTPPLIKLAAPPSVSLKCCMERLTVCRKTSLWPNFYPTCSPRRQIVTKLLDQSCKDIRKTQSDGWSSDEDDDVFDAACQEVSSPQTGPPLVSQEELASLALITPAKTSQYSGSRVKALIKILQHQLDQQELVKEFLALEHLKPSDNCLVGKAPENRDKNRYRDILPYDKTRVAIGENQEYINASYIRIQIGADEFFYISCQGPLPSTVQAFWQMVWENKSDIIAMMTQEVERGRIKCHKYWPEKQNTLFTTDRYQLHLENQQFLEYFHIKVIRMVEMKTGETHFVHHLKFTHWPDHGVPQSSEQLVRFIRYMRAVHHGGPITVHCSAGIGRTGVLICTDIILHLIENDLPINVSDIVKEMRLQRHGMIQTKEQYLFCYKVWLEVLQCLEHAGKSRG